jgi:hypothetical protein
MVEDVGNRPMRPWRWWILAAAVVAFVLIAVRAVDRPVRIDYYRVNAPNAIVVGVATGPRSWTRVVGVTETRSTVTITVSSVDFRWGPGTAYAVQVEVTVKLHDPLGDRPVLDGTDGKVAVRTGCPPPLYVAPGCVVEANSR